MLVLSSAWSGQVWGQRASAAISFTPEHANRLGRRAAGQRPGTGLFWRLQIRCVGLGIEKALESAALDGQ